MTSLKSRVIRQALSKKGFVESNADHKRLILWIGGRKTRIRTKVSHGAGVEIGDYLLSQMAKQTKLNKTQFLDLINCPLSYQEYVNILRESNVLD